MARMTDSQKEDLLADWHGLEPKHSDKVSTISTMRAELAQESFKEVSAVETAIEISS